MNLVMNLDTAIKECVMFGTRICPQSVLHHSQQNKVMQEGGGVKKRGGGGGGINQKRSTRQANVIHFQSIQRQSYTILENN